MAVREERMLIQRLQGRLKARGIEVDPIEFDLAPTWAIVTEMARLLGVEHPYMVWLYPEDLTKLLKNDYSAYAEVVDIP